MREEILMFLNQHSPTSKDAIFENKDSFSNVNWLIKFSYFCDIFEFLNKLNSLQDNNVTVFKVQERMETAIKSCL